MFDLGFIGCGNMGGALVKAAARGGARIALYDLDEEKVNALCAQTGAMAVSLDFLMQESRYVVLGVKPYQLMDLCKKLQPLARPGQAFVSMAAGVEVQRISTLLLHILLGGLDDGRTQSHPPKLRHDCQPTQNVLPFIKKHSAHGCRFLVHKQHEVGGAEIHLVKFIEKALLLHKDGLPNIAGLLRQGRINFCVYHHLRSPKIFLDYIIRIIARSNV